jgi:Na+/H+-dicarboxylate symporter
MSKKELGPHFEMARSLLEFLAIRRLWVQVLVALGLGIAAGILLGPNIGWVKVNTAKTITAWAALPGQIFLALVQMVMVPLVFSSLIRGIAGGDSAQQLKTIGMRVIVIFLTTTAAAVVIGILVAYLIEPGSGLNYSAPPSVSAPTAGAATDSALPDRLRSIIPKNPLESMVSGHMLEVVIFATIFGLALLSLGKKKAKPLLDFSDSLYSACMLVVSWAMRLVPLAIFGLIAQVISQLGFKVLSGLVWYVLTVLIGLFLVWFMYLILATFFGRVSPWKFISGLRNLQLLAFSTSSSAAVMPVSIETATNTLQVEPAVAHIVIPLGATVNMAGTALYQGVATVFLAQVFQVDLSVSALALVVVTALGASVGSPGTPGMGIVILATLLENVGIPAAGVALILGVDRILDMCRTVINVTGDLTASVIINASLTSKSRPAARQARSR